MPGSTDWVPKAEGALRTFSTSFSNVINSDPTAFGLTLTEASDFAALNTAWVNAYELATNAPTRGTVTIQNKDDAKAAMLPELRRLGMFIQNRPQTTNEQRTQLGLTLKDVEPSPTPIPSTAPTLAISRVLGQTIDYTLRDVNVENRGKPDGVIGALLFGYVGENPPLTAAEWQSLGLVTRPKNRVILPTSLYPPGSKVWLSASWVNPKGQTGPSSAAQSCFLAGGVQQAA